MRTTNLGRLLLLAFRWVDESLRASLEARGWPRITPSQSMLMANLDRAGTRTAELARRLGVSRQAAHQTVRELEDLGLVQQMEDPTNASAKLVCLTDEGERNVADALAIFADVEATLEHRVGTETVRALRRALESEWGDPIASPQHDARRPSGQ